jgi:hypothetical protein
MPAPSPPPSPSTTSDPPTRKHPIHNRHGGWTDPPGH